MRERGILLGTDGPFHNVLKIRPPMPFTRRGRGAPRGRAGRSAVRQVISLRYDGRTCNGAGVSIIIPAHNEEALLGATLARCARPASSTCRSKSSSSTTARRIGRRRSRGARRAGRQRQRAADRAPRGTPAREPRAAICWSSSTPTRWCRRGACAAPSRRCARARSAAERWRSADSNAPRWVGIDSSRSRRLVHADGGWAAGCFIFVRARRRSSASAASTSATSPARRST